MIVQRFVYKYSHILVVVCFVGCFWSCMLYVAAVCVFITARHEVFSILCAQHTEISESHSIWIVCFWKKNYSI